MELDVMQAPMMDLGALPAPAPPTESALPAALAWLVDRNLVTEDDARLTVNAAAGMGKDPLLYFKGKISLSDLHEAALRAGAPLQVSRLADLPEWTVVLNDAGGKLGNAVRNPRVAVIANDKEGREQLRCFVLHAPSAQKADLSAAVTAIVGARYHLAGRLEVPEEILAVLYGEWEGRGRKGYIKGNSDATLHAEFDEICQQSIDLNASDIHISSTGNSAEIKIRIDGHVEHFRELSAEHALELCSSVYNTLSESSSVKESFIPTKALDASIERPLRQGMYRFRFSNIPKAPAGFAVTLRIIPIGVTTKRQSAQDLGYSKDQERALQRMFAKSSGIVLFAGTTGSGKSTSLANLVWKLAEDNPGKMIRTVEEPVEILIPGVDQHPVTRIHGDQRDFMIMLRQLLRSDPDAMMIGEIRDNDTAQIAIQAARSGHLCLSTLHADGAPICYDRLIGMGVSRSDMASVNLVSGFVYQKLVPTLCPHCKVRADDSRLLGADPEMRDRLERVRQINNGSLEGIYVRARMGCDRCRHRGISGRTVCAEILRPTPDMLQAVATGDSRALWRLWRKTINRNDPSDMTGRTAFEHALYKMRQGLLAPEDVEAQFYYLDEPSFEELDQ